MTTASSLCLLLSHAHATGLFRQGGLWRGDLVLRDLQVRTDVSRKLHLPIVLQQGSVELVRLEASRRFFCPAVWLCCFVSLGNERKRRCRITKTDLYVLAAAAVAAAGVKMNVFKQAAQPLRTAVRREQLELRYQSYLSAGYRVLVSCRAHA